MATSTSNDESKLLGILLEKPPGESVDDLKQTAQLGRSHGISMFTACHTTMCPARKVIDSWLFPDATAKGEDCKEIIISTVEDNKRICERKLDSIRIIWKENVRKWHPGQEWISTSSGGGVTDMLFNPLSLIVSLFDLTFVSSSSTTTTTAAERDEKGYCGESRDQNNGTIRLVRADLVRPSNWEAPISGSAEFLMTIPLKLNNGAKNGIIMMAVPISADFAFDYEPPPSDNCNEEEIWNIEFIEAVSESDGSSSIRSELRIKDGGAQAYIDSQKVTTKPTAEYTLRPEYEALYDQFFDLLQRNRSKRSAGEVPSIVDSTTMAVLKEILGTGNWTVGPKFDF